MRAGFLLIAASLAGLLAGCSEKPPIERALTPAQLAWQPYRTGQVLRFGQANSAKVRTYEIASVDDRFEEISRGGNAPVYLGPAQHYKLQQIDVAMRRTDTVRYALTASSTPARPDSALFTQPTGLLTIGASEEEADKVGYVYVNWDVNFGTTLPINELLAGQAPPDTAQALLLPTRQLGGSTYGPVVRLRNQLSGSAPASGLPRSKPVRYVYYAENYGVVGFIEGRTLWYRLP